MTPDWWRSTWSPCRSVCFWWRGAAAMSMSCACCSARCWRSISARCCRSRRSSSVIVLVIAALYRPLAVGAFDPAFLRAVGGRAPYGAVFLACSSCWRWSRASRRSAPCSPSDRCCCRRRRRAAGIGGRRHRWRWRPASAWPRRPRDCWSPIMAICRPVRRSCWRRGCCSGLSLGVTGAWRRLMPSLGRRRMSCAPARRCCCWRVPRTPRSGPRWSRRSASSATCWRQCRRRPYRYQDHRRCRRGLRTLPADGGRCRDSRIGARGVPQRPQRGIRAVAANRCSSRQDFNGDEGGGHTRRADADRGGGASGFRQAASQRRSISMPGSIRATASSMCATSPPRWRASTRRTPRTIARVPRRMTKQIQAVDDWARGEIRQRCRRASGARWRRTIRCNISPTPTASRCSR